MSKKVKEEKTKGKRRTSILGVILVVFTSAVLIANFFSIYSDIREKDEKYAVLEEMYQEELLIKSEYEYLLDDDNRLEYIERIAREKYGYVAPGERAFYDSSYGK